MTKEEIAADRAVCDAAEPGPWTWDMPDEPTRLNLPIELVSGDNSVLSHHIDAYEAEPDDDEEDVFEADGKRWVSVSALRVDEVDAAFIAAARTRWPAALDRIEQLQAENNRLKGLVAQARGALADIAFADDLDDRSRRNKARRHYEALAAADDQIDAQSELISRKAEK